MKEVCNLIGRYSKYSASMKVFVDNYPPLAPEEMEAIQDDKCCICWEPLKAGSCCRLLCKHVHHIECIRKLMLFTRERKCPLCKQLYLEPQVEQDRIQAQQIITVVDQPPNTVEINDILNEDAES